MSTSLLRLASRSTGGLRKIARTLLLVTACALLIPAAEAGVDWPTLELAPVVTFPTDQVVGAISARDGSGRLFIVNRDGRVFIWTGSAFLETPFIDISAKTYDPQPFTEAGLLGLAFSPDYPTSGKLYLHYNRQSDGASVISRFTVSAGNANQASPNSEEVLLVVPQTSEYHKGGDLAFGPDGYLYICLGDDCQSTLPDVNPAQRLDSLLGKILRIDVSSIPPAGSAYVIPPANPYSANGSGIRKEIWAWGLRNPWRFSFDRTTGDLYIADVGENTREEINVQPSASVDAKNYGWPIREGTLPYGGNPNPVPSALTAPVFDYGREQGGSVIGGYVYRGPAGRLSGIYVFADYVSRTIWGLTYRDGAWHGQVLGTTSASPVAFTEDEDGSLSVVTTVGLQKLLDSGRTHKPIFLPLSEDFSNPVSLKVTTLTPGARLYYTLDGSTPTESSLMVPADGIVTVDAGQTLRVAAFRADLSSSLSDPWSHTFIAGTPRITTLGENSAYGHLVEITGTTRQAVYYYTLNGETPTTASAQITGTVLIKNGQFLQVFAARSGYVSSPPTFLIQPGTAYEDSEVSTLAGTGETGMRDGPAAQALFNTPSGIVWTPDNRLYITDYSSGESRIRQIDLATGLVSTLCGSTRGDVIGSLASARFGSPLNGICYNHSERSLYVADTENKKIKRIDLKNGMVNTVAITGSAPTDVCISSTGNLHWSQFSSIWTQDKSTGIPILFAGTGVSLAAGLSSNFSLCGGENDTLLAFSGGVRLISPEGAVQPYIGNNLGPNVVGNADGPFGNGRVYTGSVTSDIIRDSIGSIYLTTGSAVRKIVPGHAIRTLAGNQGYSNSVPYLNGPGSTARFGFSLSGLAVDAVGCIYVADTYNKRIRLIKQSDWDADGIPDSAEVAPPYKIGSNDGLVDSDGDLLSNAMEYITGTDPANSKSALRPSLTWGNGAPTLSWPSQAGVLYLIETSTDLIVWKPLPLVVEGSGGNLEWTPGEALPSERRAFFRIIPFLATP